MYYNNKHYYRVEQNKDNTYQLYYLGGNGYERTVDKAELKKLLARQQNKTSVHPDCFILNAKLLKNNSIKIIDYDNDKSDTRQQYIDKLNKLTNVSSYSIFTCNDLKRLYSVVCSNISKQNKEVNNRLGCIHNDLNSLRKTESKYNFKEIEQHIIRYKKDIYNLFDDISFEKKRIREVDFRLDNGVILLITYKKPSFEVEIDKLNKLLKLSDKLLYDKIFNNKKCKELFYEKLLNKLTLECCNYDNNKLHTINEQSENIYKSIIKEFVDKHLDKLIKFDYELSISDIDMNDRSYTKNILDKFSDEISKIVEKYIGDNTEILSKSDIVNIINNIRDSECEDYKSVKIKWRTKKYNTGYYEKARRDETTIEFETVASQRACVMTYNFTEYYYVNAGLSGVGKQEIVVLKTLHDKSKFYILNCKDSYIKDLSCNEHDIDFIKDNILEQIDHLKIKISSKDKLHMILGFFNIEDSKIGTIRL